ncbi:hypothetical protein [Desulfuromonas sp.]|mgnify:CR=1 FL=1|uniref:hypothetical protein n=1 Tax=Desulfuromonas sp. TaxID=892 RepID=UPI0025BC3D84|nr:hypothetical protein [Desulfuromonas sp.]
MFISFQKILQRITGISTPLGGISWSPPVNEIAVAERVVTMCEDRRVITPRFAQLNPITPLRAISSIQEIREILTREMVELSRGSELFEILTQFRTSCTECLSELEVTGIHDKGFAQAHTLEGVACDFSETPNNLQLKQIVESLSIFRTRVHLILFALSTRYHIDLPSDYLELLPKLPTQNQEASNKLINRTENASVQI